MPVGPPPNALVTSVPASLGAHDLGMLATDSSQLTSPTATNSSLLSMLGILPGYIISVELPNRTRIRPSIDPSCAERNKSLDLMRKNNKIKTRNTWHERRIIGEKWP